MTAAEQHSDPIKDTAAKLGLRIMATTDLHMQLVDHDYVTNQSARGQGLAGLATLIAQARKSAVADGRLALLVDNGDALQGTPLAEWAAGRPVDKNHPLVSAFNFLEYDAIGLGNHDFDYGTDYLRRVASQLNMPVICSNLHGMAIDPVCHSRILTRVISGGTQTLKVGVLSILPPQTLIWNKSVFAAGAEINPPLDCLRQMVPALKNAGADVVIVLAHLGLEDSPPGSDSSAAKLIAGIPGVDALITGHTHQRLPGPDMASLSGVDAFQGRIGAVATVMAGHHGSDLAVIDLDLERAPDGNWSVTDTACQLLPNDKDIPPSPEIRQLTSRAHRDVVQHLETVVTETETPIHSFFGLLRPSMPSALLALAKINAIKSAVSETSDAALPLLGMVATHRSGGRGGPAHFVDIPKGPIKLRHLGALDPYSNQVWAIRVTGRQVRRWLEKSTGIFAGIEQDRPDQELINGAIPSFAFDTVFGLSYTIDPSVPPGGCEKRIIDLCHDGKPIRDDQRFLVATNQFRAAGGGGFDPTPDDDVALRIPKLQPSDFKAAFAAIPSLGSEYLRPWKLQQNTGLQAVFETAPEAENHLGDIAQFRPQPLGLSARGFLRLRITL